MKTISTTRLARKVDELAVVRAEIAALRDRETALTTYLKEFAGGESMTIEGDLHDAVVSRSVRGTVNWKKIAKDLGASAAKIAGNTRRSSVVSVRLYGKSAEAKAA